MLEILYMAVITLAAKLPSLNPGTRVVASRWERRFEVFTYEQRTSQPNTPEFSDEAVTSINHLTIFSARTVLVANDPESSLTNLARIIVQDSVLKNQLFSVYSYSHEHSKNID